MVMTLTFLQQPLPVPQRSFLRSKAHTHHAPRRRAIRLEYRVKYRLGWEIQLARLACRTACFFRPSRSQERNLALRTVSRGCLDYKIPSTLFQECNQALNPRLVRALLTRK